MPSVPSVPSWFGTIERRSLLLSAARAWKGTPFFPNSEAPGRDGGVDCVRLIHGIYRTLGVIPFIELPRYVMDHGQHSERSLLIEAFETWPALRERFVRLPDCLPASIAPGDTLCFTAGKVPHHGGLMLVAGEFLQAMGEEGVHCMQLAAAVRGWRILGSLAAVYRPLAEVRSLNSQPSTLNCGQPAAGAA